MLKKCGHSWFWVWVSEHEEGEAASYFTFDVEGGPYSINNTEFHNSIHTCGVTAVKAMNTMQESVSKIYKDILKQKKTDS